MGDGYIEGRNAVLEAINSGKQVDKLFVAKGEADAALKNIISKARASGAVISEVDRRKLDSMSETKAHQGVIAAAACTDYVTIADIIETSRK